jgi:SAM-dependent methyltransferase
MNVRTIIDEIHSRVERESSQPQARNERDDIGRLHVAYRRLYEVRNLVGQMPPGPNTLRAKIGRQLIRIVQRMLFWYTPQILKFQNEVTSLLSASCDLIGRQSESIDMLQKEVAALRSKPSEILFETQSVAANRAPAMSLPASFEFALQDHFRGSEETTAEKLGAWLAAITDAIKPRGSLGPWLDIGCGRGEWLAMASSAGHQVTGIDSNRVSIDYCRARNRRAERAEALEYLAGVPDGSLAVVTAFHVAEHLPADGLPALIASVSRKLKPGGLFAVETPDPANLLMGSHFFWNDPTHQRPIPLALMEFIFRYSGLDVIQRLHLNPFPPEEHLPYTEVDLIQRVDSQLYGPRDYGLIGRREE